MPQPVTISTVIVVHEQIQESAVLRRWALAECANPERWSWLGTVVPAHVTERLRDGLPVEEREWIAEQR